MYIIQKDTNGKVIDFFNNAREDVTQESLRVVPYIPVCEPRAGFNGVLMYNDEQGLYWEYVEVVKPDHEPTTIEEKALAYDILIGEAE